MPICIICKEEYYHQTETDPPDHCLCGENASGTLWQWNRHRAYIKRFRYWLAYKFYDLANYLTNRQ